ncbi:MAG: lipoyl(octanoyl) transferase LipB [Clostridiales bacterium]|nr:lipoyl(octanoyl) transferase LipB [Clostridiales bacterium]MCF8021098.1 lipoyl(octanoyl) transferase LipB [Clostridiales bacterium]
MPKLLVSVQGETDYDKALKVQEKLLYLRQQNKVEDIMLILQHPPTLTMGKNAKDCNVIIPEEELKKQGGNIYKTSRGGDVTYHGPGQIVGYPIIDLKYNGISVREYIYKIEETFIQLLNYEYKIAAVKGKAYRGVWIDNEKITAIGCAVKRWVTMHGFAFNINTNLEHYNWIIPCGITGKGITSLQKILGQPQDIVQVNKQVIKYFCKILNLEPEIINEQKLHEVLERN